jgi:hypothetical protein
MLPKENLWFTGHELFQLLMRVGLLNREVDASSHVAIVATSHNGCAGVIPVQLDSIRLH